MLSKLFQDVFILKNKKIMYLATIGSPCFEIVAELYERNQYRGLSCDCKVQVSFYLATRYFTWGL